MERRGWKSAIAATPRRPPADPLLLDLDLREWAGERIAEGGRKDALLGRVEALGLSFDGRRVEGRVRGKRPLPYRVEVAVDDARLEGRCTCSREQPGICRHVVALIETLRFPAPAVTPRRSARGRTRSGHGRIIQHAQTTPGFMVLGGPERILTRHERITRAQEDELAIRRQRARYERARVEPQDDDGGPPRFRITARRAPATQEIVLRGSAGQFACCGCDDFHENELLACKHTERLGIWSSRLKKSERRFAPQGMCSLFCYPRVWEQSAPRPLEELRIVIPDDRMPAALARWFDPSGWLRPASGGSEADHARSAICAARGEAESQGWIWEIDPLVRQRIEAVAEHERFDGRAVGEDRFARTWARVVGSLGVRLHPYQEQGVRFLVGRGRAFLADDMGLGKTIQAIVAALLLRRLEGARKTLIVCPASLKHQWRSEIGKVCGESATVVDGAAARRMETYACWREGFLILNYELVLRDLDAIRDARADLIVLDEAQRIKNWETKTARAVKRLESSRAFILTGTPLENRLLELHSLAEFLHPRALGPRWRLIPFHAVIDDQSRTVAYEGLELLRERMRGFFLRRERDDVLDELPERTDHTFWTGMSAAQRAPYRKYAATAATLLSQRRRFAAAEVRTLFRALTAMRMLCNARAQLEWEQHAPRLAEPAPPTELEIRALHSPKLEEFRRVLEDLLDESSDKVVVFSQWERMLRLAQFVVRGTLEERDVRSEVFHGRLNGAARSRMLEAFDDDPEFRVLFSTDAGGLGLNLQHAASVVVHLEVPWNPAVLEQRIGRVHRMGQRRNVRVLHFVTRDAIEQRVRQVVEDKRALFDGLLVDQADRVVFEDRTASRFIDRLRAVFDLQQAAPDG